MTCRDIPAELYFKGFGVDATDLYSFSTAIVLPPPSCILKFLQGIEGIMEEKSQREMREIDYKVMQINHLAKASFLQTYTILDEQPREQKVLRLIPDKNKKKNSK